MAAFLQAVQSVIEILLMIALGFILQKKQLFSMPFQNDISKLVMDIALPCSIFMAVLNDLTIKKLASLTIGFILVFGEVILGYLISFVIIKWFKISPLRRTITINTMVNSNTVFIGLPLNLALFGNKSIGYFLVYYVVTIVSTWSFGVYLISRDDPEKQKSQQHFHWADIFSRPLQGFIAAIAILLIKIPFKSFALPQFLTQSLTYIGSMVIPLSLIYIGCILAKAGLKSIYFDKDTLVALFGRFIIGPALMIIIVIIAQKYGIKLLSTEKQTYIIQASVPALATLPILAEKYHLDIRYATNVVVITTVAFLVVIPVMMTLSEFI
ncbi:AEC family transporter [Oenococcus sp. UCMA 17063]|nr:AEC family transporter [Oenococcus sp. UCMA 17063]